MNRYTSEVYERYENLDQDQLLKNREHVKLDSINYPLIHIAPKSGLLNDPNGLIYYNGVYHIFYQVCPNGTYHGMKSWNLITTVDFVNYKDYGVILQVSEEYENYGIFSGGATIINGKLHLLYTGNYRDPSNNYKRKAYQVIAELDSCYKVVSKRIIRMPDENIHTEHFRDPVVVDDNTILVGMQDLNMHGQLALINYSNQEYKGESKISLIEHNWNIKSYMFECPNLFKIDGKSVLLFSPQGVESKNKYNYNNIHDVVYSITDKFDVKQPKWESKQLIQLDSGFDFYAPQVFNDGSRTLLLGWLGLPDTIYPGDEKNCWSQMLTTIRELSIVDDCLYQKPISEYEKLEIKWEKFTNKYNLKNKTFRLKVRSNSDFKIEIGNEEYKFLIIRNENDLVIDRSNCQYNINQKYGTKRYVEIEEKYTNLDIIIDRSCIEIFVNDGKYVSSSRFFIDKLENIMVEDVSDAAISYLNNINIS